MKNNPILIISTSALALIMSACGQGYKSTGSTDTTSGVGLIATATGTGTSTSTGTTTTGTTSTAQQQLSAIDLNGSLSSTVMFSGLKFMQIDSVAQTLDLELPMGGNPLSLNLTYAIPQLPGAVAGMLQDSAGNWFLGVKIPLSVIAHGITTGNSQSLPNGKALPSVPGGTLPSIEFNIGGQIPVHLYLGVNIAAAFIELPATDKYMAYLNLVPLQLNFNIKSKAGTVIGSVAPIAPVTAGGVAYNGGVFVATKLPASVTAVIDKLF